MTLFSSSLISTYLSIPGGQVQEANSFNVRKDGITDIQPQNRQKKTRYRSIRDR